MSDISTNLAIIRKAIEAAATAAGRNPEEISLIAVSKMKPRQAVEAAFSAGQSAFGENKVQEAASKYASPLHGAELHLIGPLQSNKTRDAAALFNWIHTVDRLKILHRLDTQLQENGRTIKALIQVNLAGESQKSGCSPEQLPALIEAFQGASRLSLQGLMIIPPFSDDPEETRPWFKRLRMLRDDLVASTGVALPQLSMGMSGDYQVAIEEGATMVRIGTAVFGERDYGIR